MQDIAIDSIAEMSKQDSYKQYESNTKGYSEKFYLSQIYACENHE